MAPTAVQRPNILLVNVDQWPGRLLGCAGHPVIETPTLDALAADGVRFARAYSECPICIPARRTLMTGTTPRSHGDRIFQPALPMPALPTLAQCFRDAGYQATAVGKLHVYPSRDRIGFDDVWLAEEGRPQLGSIDDYDLFLGDQGLPGRQYLHGMSNNDYGWRPWHLDESLHVTSWCTTTMARTIRRRDPTRPAFWYLSYTHPHPPLVPLASYLERYARREIDPPVLADWARDEARLPYALRLVRRFWAQLDEPRLADARRAFYALCTHIDHQLRVVIGTLREEGILDDTAIVFTSDHGDMLGDNGLYAKRYLYEGSACIPLLVVLPVGDRRLVAGHVDPRPVGLQDVMPTLLDVAGIEVPPHCDGRSLLGTGRRATLYCEALEGAKATRMVTDGRYKLIWYPAGNHVQLFDLDTDPRELHDRAADADCAAERERLTEALLGELHGSDLDWLQDGQLIGCRPPELVHADNRGLSGQRGLHWPAPLPGDPTRTVGTP